MEAVKLSNKKQINSLVFLFSITYMISYMTRINYGAIIAEMQTELPICSVSGAVMRMDLADLPALMFRNSAHGDHQLTVGSEQILGHKMGLRFS